MGDLLVLFRSKFYTIFTANIDIMIGDIGIQHIDKMVRWCWGWLGRDIGVVLPSCAVNFIRKSFPSSTYTVFSYPPIS